MDILLLYHGRHKEVWGGDRHFMPLKGIDNKPQKGLMTMKIVHLCDSNLKFSSIWKPTFTLQLDSMDESLCKALVLKSFFCDAMYSVVKGCDQYVL